MKKVPELLQAVAAGNTQAGEHLLPLVYAEIKRIAHQMMTQEPPGHTLQTTALVHEAWLRLTEGREQPWQSRAHFIGAAAEAMRRILVERARRKQRQKHGGDHERVDATELEFATDTSAEHLLAIHDVLDRFAREEPRQAALVKLRFFGGLEVKEAADALGISEATAARDWEKARAWLEREIQAERSG